MVEEGQEQEQGRRRGGDSGRRRGERGRQEEGEQLRRGAAGQGRPRGAAAGGGGGRAPAAAPGVRAGAAAVAVALGLRVRLGVGLRVQRGQLVAGLLGGVRRAAGSPRGLQVSRLRGVARLVGVGWFTGTMPELRCFPCGIRWKASAVSGANHARLPALFCGFPFWGAVGGLGISNPVAFWLEIGLGPVEQSCPCVFVIHVAEPGDFDLSGLLEIRISWLRV